MNNIIKRKTLKSNYLYQFLYQFFILVLPLITAPYLTRTLSSSDLGAYTYSYSIAYYFVVFANLGIMKHGQRVIAQSSGDSDKLRKTFWSLYTIHACLSILSIVLYFSFVLLFVNEDKSIFFLQLLFVSSTLFDTTWLFYGLENFKNVAIKNGLIKLLNTVLIFFFVKTKEDIWVYSLIASGDILLGQLILFPTAVIAVKPIKIQFSDIKAHLKPLFILSIAVIAITLYKVFDKTLLGLMTGKENVAYYEYSDKIIAIPTVFAAVIGTVMYPRACSLAKAGDYAGQKRYLDISLKIVFFIGFASLFGLLAISRQFALFYYGESFSEVGKVMLAMSVLPLVLGLGDVIRTQYMIPNKMDKLYTICIILNAIINLVLSLSLIPALGIYGAVIGTISAELFGLCFQIMACKRFISFKVICKSSFPFAFIGLIMYLLIKPVPSFIENSLAALLVQIIAGFVVFCVLSLMYFIFFEKEIWHFFTKSIHKKSNLNKDA